MRLGFLLALITALSSCATAPPCDCPGPEVVEVVVTERQVLPFPLPPGYQECLDLKAAYHNFVEADEAFNRCVEIIRVNNE